jgi:hypothetical protein
VSCFRETPENTPYSLLLLGVMAFLFYIVVVFQWVMADVERLHSVSTSILAGGLLLFSYGIYTYGLLYLFRFSYRSVQLLTCLLAGHTIVHLLAFPMLLFWWLPWGNQGAEVSPVSLLTGVVYLVLTFGLGIWQLMISAYIYKNALEINYFAAILASFGLIACNILIVSFWR